MRSSARPNSSPICSSVQKMWQSSWVSERTRVRPLSSPLFVAVERRELSVAQGQLAVRVELLIEERHVRRAVHRLEPQPDALVLHDREHDVTVVLQVAGADVEVFFDQVTVQTCW